MALLTYRSLLAKLNRLDEEQLDQDVTLSLISPDNEFELFAALYFFNPKVIHAENPNYRKINHADDIDGPILDEGHPYITVFL